MTPQELIKQLEKRIMILDGSSGTALLKRGMPKGVCPEKWGVENPDEIIKLQKEYIEAGSDVIYTFTLGANPLKLLEFGLNKETYRMNKELAEISRRAAGKKALVAGDIATSGHLPKPFGNIPFEDAVDYFKEQVRGLLDGGVDLFVIETMMDIQEARAAVLAVKESCELPVMVSLTFDKDKRTLTGTGPVPALITMQSLGVDVFGVNCSTGPKEMAEIIEEIKPYANIPVFAKPNAGMPKLVNNESVFDMNAVEFASFAERFASAGVNLFGGCCGTTPEYIKLIAEKLKGIKPRLFLPLKYSAVSSAREAVFIGGGRPIAVIGERINPTGKKQLQQELKHGYTAEIKKLALEQEEAGAVILDVNAGMPGIDEKEKIKEIINIASVASRLPLCVDSSSPDVVEAALRIYPGKAVINSISGEEEKLKKLLPIAAKYGASFILLPLSDTGIPEDADTRYQIVEYVVKQAKKHSIPAEDIIVDGLVMTVSANQKAAAVTLELIEKCSKKLLLNTVIGLSNVSFGLPERSVINASFLAMAAAKGLAAVIANPSSDIVMKVKNASDVLCSYDKNASNYIKHFSSDTGAGEKKETREKAGLSVLERLRNGVINGQNEETGDLALAAAKEGVPAGKIVDDVLIPAINRVGEFFDEKKYFLPQLIQSAEAMKNAFAAIEHLLVKDGKAEKKTNVVLATVKGDIHDIGKNIVGLMLRNYGFNVHDLGKDVPAEDIIKKALETEAEIIGLSALMTTTMTEMKVVVELAKEKGVKSKIMIGGAVVTQEYADEIGAHGYSKDAYEAVKLADELGKKE
ncbi:MAG TPA: 5-methyltetrahydrofolate--homocysteine methyltransferase [bacterium]|nr:5-methyltetrahydrofolate--homocysteine methyltransferase [bacterium]